MRGDGRLDAIVVRRAQPADWVGLRALRLEALRDTPIGFLETALEAESLGDDDWQARAARGAIGGDSLGMLALEGGMPVGMCVGFLRDGRAVLAAVYITPARRGAGLLTVLVAAVTRWSAEQGVSELLLNVHEDNVRALRAYEKLGFVATGQRVAYPPDPSREELAMVRTLV